MSTATRSPDRAAPRLVGWFRRTAWTHGLVLGVAAVACVDAAPPPDEPETPPGPPLPVAPEGHRVTFAFETLDGSPFTTESVRGRYTAIGFIATYDVASSAEARFLKGLHHHFTPRINVALLVLEPRTNQPLVEAFVAALELDYPVAFADAATIAGEGPFEGLHHIPSVVILDPDGREVWRHIGLVDEDTLANALRSLRGDSAPAPRPE